MTLDKVVVTGSHIPQIDGETALPVQIITREEIERLGVTTVEQLLEHVSANFNGFSAVLSCLAVTGLFDGKVRFTHDDSNITDRC